VRSLILILNPCRWIIDARIAVRDAASLVSSSDLCEHPDEKERDHDTTSGIITSPPFYLSWKEVDIAL
jgi:hypothetical protein